MSGRAVQFLELWMENNDLRSLDDVGLVDLAARLFFDAEAKGISEEEVRDGSVVLLEILRVGTLHQPLGIKRRSSN